MLSARTGQPGTAGERLDAEQDAIRGLGITAQVFKVNQYIGATGHKDRRAQYPLSERELYEAQEAFVPPDDQDRLVGEVRSRTVVLLGGRAGTGKYALARSLLLQAGHRTLFCLDSESDLSRLTAADLKRGAGYILPDLPRHAANSLTFFTLQRLTSELSGLDCRLVVTVAAPDQISDDEVARTLIGIPAQPEPARVAAAHMRWEAGVDQDANARMILARPDVSELLRDCLAEAFSSEAAELGRQLAETASSVPEDEVAQRVRTRLELRGSAAFARWLANLDDLARQCLAIGVAAFGGEAYVTVASLSRDLAERLQVEESPEHPDRRRGTPLGETRTRRLADIQATLVESEVETRHGGARGLVVRYRDRKMAVRVLEHVWHEYDEIREVLPHWLHDCAANALTTVGTRAAVAAGLLAQHAFETVRTRILLPWATDAQPQLRDAAATALGVVASDPAHAAAAYNLVSAWSADDVAPELRATAARAWRVVFERDGAEQAWALLHVLAGSEENTVLDAVCQSVTDYMALEEGRYCRDALDLIDQWTVSGNYGPRRRLAGELAFLYAATDLVDRLPGRLPGGGQRVWPALLAVVDRDRDLRPQVAQLWERTVNSPDLYEFAQDVLAEWARLVEPDPLGRGALARLLVSAVTRPRTELILRHQASAWIRSDGGLGAPATGREVLDHLDRGSAEQ
ncbi:hypothetical protein AB0B50_21565 [Streptomyces sp. NPDC041068]|uniref:hypothetical protein n=1 Tax=Streptomyces sp. NPDC041068 TaxID=3155130 RepID=UPI0033C2DE38